MTTKAERNEQMNTLIRDLPRKTRLGMAVEGGRGRIVVTEPAAADQTGKQDGDKNKGASDDDT